MRESNEPCDSSLAVTLGHEDRWLSLTAFTRFTENARGPELHKQKEINKSCYIRAARDSLPFFDSVPNRGFRNSLPSLYWVRHSATDPRKMALLSHII